MMRIERLKLYLILAGIIIGIILSIVVLDAFWTEWLLVNERLHSTLEAAGGLAAIVIALLLIQKKRGEYGGKFFLLGMGFLGMGLLDIFHSASSPGHGFILLRSAASFVGAFWFALTWIPGCASERGAAWKSWAPWAVVMGAIVFGIWTLAARETLPIMMKGQTFTATAVTIHLLSGVFFMAAAIRLLIDFGRIGRPEIYLFACMATLFGLANLIFPMSALWDNTWWFWHLLRLTSYALALGFVIHEHQQTISDLRAALGERKKAEEELRKHRDRLEELVQERTTELRKANEGLQQEITERKRAEQELRESEERLEAIMDNSPAVIYLKDGEGRYMLVNHHHETLFHVARGRIKGITDYDIFPKEMADAFRANDLKVIEAGTPLEFEEVVPQDDGMHIYLSNKFPLYDSSGALYGVCGISMDITERKQMEEQEIAGRERAESWFQSLIDTTQDAVVSIDRESRIGLFNPAAQRIFGYSRAEVRGQKIGTLMVEPHASEHDGYIARYEWTGERHAIGRIRTVAALRKSGEVFPAEVSLTRVAGDGSDDVRYVAFIRDISEKARLQEQAIESERLAAIGAIAATLAHEIGNPLNGMYLTIQLLERRLARYGDVLEESVSTTLRALAKEITRLNQLLVEFRSLSRREKYSFRPTALAAVVAEVLEIEASYYTALGVHVEQIFPQDLPSVMADGEKLQQAVLNLCKNAVEAMPNGGTITLRGRNFGEQVVLEVMDTGLGIPDEVDIFEPFATTKTWGSGLGLVIVRQIVAAHGGTIKYTSERGKGTAFRLTLPACSSPTATL
jgi:PAS domain S-box-containing protein